MRKQNDCNPPELKPNGRLINSVLRSRKHKRPNAQKCGLYARPLSFPVKTRTNLIKYVPS